MPGQYMQYGYECHINSAEMTQFKLRGRCGVYVITEQCGTKQNLPLKMVPVNPLAHGLLLAST